MRSNRITGFAVKRLLHDQPGCQLYPSFADAAERRPSINAVNPSRVRCEAGILVTMGYSFGVLLCRARQSPCGIGSAKDAPRQIPSKSRTSPALMNLLFSIRSSIFVITAQVRQGYFRIKRLEAVVAFRIQDNGF